MEPYPYHTYIRKGKQCTEVFIRNLHEFNREIHSYINALLNSCGGIIKLGIESDGYVNGIECRRDTEDNIKLTMDNTVKFFQPKVSPALYRLNFVPCEVTDHRNGCVYDVPDVKVVEIHVSAGTEMDKKTQKSMVLHNGKPMLLGPQQIQALAIAKYKQEVLHADTLWDVITPACMKKKGSRLKKPPGSTAVICTQTTPGLAPAVSESRLKKPPGRAAVICTQTTPGLAPAATPKPAPSHSVSIGSNTPCPTPVAELLFISPQNTPNTAVKVGNKRSLSPDSSGTVKRMPARSCKDTPNNNEYIQVIEDSPDIVCLGSVKKAIGNAISISDSTPTTPFAAESNGDTVVKRVLRSSSKINDTLEPSLVKNPSDLFSEEPTEESRSRTRKRHKAGDSSKHHKRSKKSSSRKRHKSSSSHNSEGRHRSKSSSSDSRERRRRSKSSSKSPETRGHRRKERSRQAESGTRKGKSSEATLETNEGTMNVEKPGNSGKDAPYGSKTRITGKENKILEGTQKCATKDGDSVESSKSTRAINASRDAEVLKITSYEKGSRATVDAKKSVVKSGKSEQTASKEKGGHSLRNVMKTCTANDSNEMCIKQTRKSVDGSKGSEDRNDSSVKGSKKCSDQGVKKSSDGKSSLCIEAAKTSKSALAGLQKVTQEKGGNMLRSRGSWERYKKRSRGSNNASTTNDSRNAKEPCKVTVDEIKCKEGSKKVDEQEMGTKTSCNSVSSKRNIKVSSPPPGSITSVLNHLRDQTSQKLLSAREDSDTALKKIKTSYLEESTQKSEDKLCVSGANKDMGGQEEGVKTSNVVVPVPEKDVIAVGVAPSLSDVRIVFLKHPRSQASEGLQLPQDISDPTMKEINGDDTNESKDGGSDANKKVDVKDTATKSHHRFVVPKRKIIEVSTSVSNLPLPVLKCLRGKASQRLQNSIQNRNIHVSHPPYSNNPAGIRHPIINHRSFASQERQPIPQRPYNFRPFLSGNRWNVAGNSTNPYQTYVQSKPTDYAHQSYQQPYYFGQEHQTNTGGNMYGGVPHLGWNWQQGTGNTAFWDNANRERRFSGSYNQNHLQ